MKSSQKTSRYALLGLGALSLNLLALLTMATSAWAQEAAALDSGDTAWLITATALVLFMTLPGLALFYGGLVRTKNVLSVLGQCLAMAAVMTLLWIIYGYSYAATEGNAIIGGFSKLFLNDLTVDSLSGTIPESVFLTFQMTFAIITPTLIVGAFAERMKFSAMLIFMIIWFTFSYVPVWHMAWGDGGLFVAWSVLDFAGGTVVHINAGIAALVVCVMIGPRKGYPGEPMRPHNLVLTVVGAGMLWVGWFGFNAGSALAADGTAGMAVLVTQISTATAVVVWMLIEWFRHGKPSILGMATAAIAGLGAITPASGTAGPMGAMLIGAVSAVLCYLATTKIKQTFGYDDSLDVFGVHGVGGIVGTILTGLCAAEYMGGAGFEAATAAAQVIQQVKAVIVTIILSGIVSLVAYFVANALTGGARISEEGEQMGLDLMDHDESGYIS